MIAPGFRAGEAWPGQTPNAFRESLAQARRDWAAADPRQAAALAGAALGEAAGGLLHVRVSYYGRELDVSHPNGQVTEAATGRAASPSTEVLLLHYLLTADGAEPTGDWVAFHDLPFGRIYQTAFAGRSLAPLSAAFGSDRDGFARAALSVGGQPMRLGDASYWFRAFPRLAVAAVLWLGEEDLPGSVNILFDSSAGHYLPTEDLSLVGGVLSGRLLRARAQPTA